MADAATTNLVQQIVLRHVAANGMFTAYDITMEARKQGANLRHDEARDIVHKLFTDGVMGAAYQRTTVDVGAPTKPFVYHRFSDDPHSYRSPGSGGSTGTAQTGTPASGAKQPGIVQRIVSSIFGGGSKGSGSNPASNAPSGGANSGAGSPPRQTASPPNRPITNRPSTKLDLDASAFLPISRTELLTEAKKVSLWSSPWFGRRDLIPPVDDSRTALIDRAMLTHGLLTPEQLAEIHRVGADMDRYRPADILIRRESDKAGADAVEAERKARQEAKAKKKAEAAAKREARRAAIAQRKANDIVFLGRGVSGRLGERVSDRDKLTSLGLPILATPADVAVALGLTIPQLRWLAFHAEVATRTHYVSFQIPKKSGGMRTLSAPHGKMAAAQRWILNEVLNKLPTESCAHGFVRERSIVTNARPHVGQAIVINMDLESFFPSITFPRVRKLFVRIGYSPAVATILALLCTESPRRSVTFAGQPYLVATGPRGLPQGACTSPAISNQIARRLDRRLMGLSSKMDLTYTRYADDLTLSGGDTLNERVGYVMACVRHIAADEGFVVNEKKSRVLRRNTAQSVTGLIVNEKPNVSRHTLKRVRAILHQAQKEGLAAQNREGRANFRAWLDGMISFIAMTRPELGAEFRRQFRLLDS